MIPKVSGKVISEVGHGDLQKDSRDSGSSKKYGMQSMLEKARWLGNAVQVERFNAISMLERTPWT